MKKYHIKIDNTQKGPFSLDELGSYQLNKSTMVWFQGLSDWTELQNIDELKFLLYIAPPFTKKTDNNEAAKKSIARQITYAFKLFKKSFFIAPIFLLGFAILSNLIAYSVFDKKIDEFDAEQILGYKPNQFSYISSPTLNPYSKPSNTMVVISEKGIREVKALIVRELIKQSVIFTLIMVPVTFCVLLLYHYAKKGIHWTKKYSK